MLEYTLNIIGSEWLIIIFIVLILLLGTNRFPEAAKKIGKIVGEYNNAKNQVQNQMKDVTNENIKVTGPVKDERKKLEMMAKTLGVDSKNKTDKEIKKIIDDKIGKPEKKLIQN
uniref:Sec-independent translocation protein mttA/Hcf106 (TatA) n=2 Tax=environmental samples TaxID=651140 RepID=A0A075GK07_9ARCH|nr:sec-independent translocation protein mttA/Hcf106 (tatA) [uncultured marine thaumarchaeote KM3_167_H09]AIF12445.1 sec-independent translocation protein mttA/Hcf106 (tatA) [uncultured marine thaumarchaeote KM3_55_G04]